MLIVSDRPFYDERTGNKCLISGRISERKNDQMRSVNHVNLEMNVIDMDHKQVFWSMKLYIWPRLCVCVCVCVCVCACVCVCLYCFLEFDDVYFTKCIVFDFI